MKKNKIVLAGSFVVLSAIFVYVSVQKDEQVATVVKETKSVQTIEQVARPEAVKIPEPDKVLTEKIPPAIPKLKKSEAKFQTKYKLSILPENMSIQEKKQRFN